MKIKIAGIDYVVNIGKKQLYNNEGVEVDGTTEIDRQTINLAFCKDAGKDYKNLVLLHELTHLLFYYSGIGDSKLWDNENDVHKFSVLLHQVLKDNKLL